MTYKASQLTIIDLSCPCVTPETACLLFNICLSIFLEQPDRIGRVIALDEAHKYMTNSPESRLLTDSLLQTIRLQRHLGARVIISTQEPTVSPQLLDLCTVTIVHRFTSPDWLRALERHLAGVSSAAHILRQAEELPVRQSSTAEGEIKATVRSSSASIPGLFAEIVALGVGEAIVFSPSAITGHRSKGAADEAAQFKRLANGMLKVRVRARVTTDGGRSKFAT